jgi:hypothetical protein
VNIFDDINGVNGALKPYKTGNRPQGMAGKYSRAVRAEDGAPVGDTRIVPSRTLEPTTDYVYGVDKESAPKIPGPYILEAPLLPGHGDHRPVWRGWRPNRPQTSYAELGASMMISDRTNKFEASIPTEDEVIDMASRNASAPYPALPSSEMIPDPYRTRGMLVSGLGQSEWVGGEVTGEEVLPPKPVDNDPLGIGVDIAAVVKDVVGLVTAQYPQNVEAYRAGAAAKSAAVAANPLPWSTILTVGGIALAAVFILPKVLK